MVKSSTPHSRTTLACSMLAFSPQHKRLFSFLTESTLYIVFLIAAFNYFKAITENTGTGNIFLADCFLMLLNRPSMDDSHHSDFTVFTLACNGQAVSELLYLCLTSSSLKSSNQGLLVVHFVCFHGQLSLLFYCLFLCCTDLFIFFYIELFISFIALSGRMK